MCLLWAAGAQAQKSGVSVTGVVEDETGAILADAPVDLIQSDGTTRSTRTDAVGRFKFDQVPPGTCQLAVRFEGFEPASVQIRVGTRQPPTLRVQMKIAGITQEVTVSNTESSVRTGAAQNRDAVVVDQAVLENLPVFDQDYLAAMSRFLDTGSLGTNGATLIVNGAEVNSLGVSASAIQQIKINQDPYSAEYPRPGRGRIEVITKPGSEQYHGTFNVTFRDARLNARDPFSPEPTPEQRRIFEGSFGGPVMQSRRTSFLLSASGDQEDLVEVVHATGPEGLIQDNVPHPLRHMLVALGVTHQAGENNTLSIRATYEDETNKNQGVGGTTLAEAGTNFRHLEENLIYSQQTIFSKRLLNQFRLLLGQEFEPTSSVFPGQKIVVLDQFTGGGAQADLGRTEHHFTLTESLTWTPGRHVVKTGLNIPDWSRRGFDDRRNFGGTFSFSNLVLYDAGRPYSFTQQQGDGNLVFVEKVLGGFVQDEITALPNLSVSIGLRYDWQNYFHDNHNIAPRASFAWSPRADGKTVVRGGTGLFYDRSGPFPIADLLYSRQGRLFRYLITDPDFPDPFNSGSISEPPSIVQLDPASVFPFTWQYSVALERQLGKSTLTVSYIGSQGIHSFRSRDINAPRPPFYADRPDSTHGAVRQIETTGGMRANTFQLTLRGNLTRFFSGTTQYSWTHASNDTSGIAAFPANNYDLSGEWGPADFEQRHRFDLLGTFRPGKLFNLGLSLALYSGKPYSMTTGRDTFNDGLANDRPAGITRNSLRGPSYADVDVRWSRDLRLKPALGDKSPTVTFGIDAFNVLNHVNFTSYIGTLSSPFFGGAVSAQPPRRLQISLRVKG
jgi:outer membrane receptor protein involved in Fe transport